MSTPPRGLILPTPEPVAPAPLRNYTRRDPVAVAFGKAVGIQRPEVARQRLMRVEREMPIAIRAYREHGTPERLQRFVAPTELALSGYVRAPALTASLEMSAEERDLTEDLREKAYDLNPTRENAIARVRSIDADVALALLIRAALVEKHSL
jgi:hypothetical protein